MARMTAPNGSTVNVSDERAKALLTQGYTAVGSSGEKKAPAKKSASRKSEK